MSQPSAAFKAVQSMYGPGVAERLEDAGLLVRDHIEPKLNQAGVVMDVPSHWNLVIEFDPTYTAPGWQHIPHGIDRAIKNWLYDLQRNSKADLKFQKAYTDLRYGTGKRWLAMVRKVPGITAELVPCVLVPVN